MGKYFNKLMFYPFFFDKHQLIFIAECPRYVAPIVTGVVACPFFCATLHTFVCGVCTARYGLFPLSRDTFHNLGTLSIFWGHFPFSRDTFHILGTPSIF